MITRDFNSNPDHRLNFFGFLKAVINHAFVGINNINNINNNSFIFMSK